MKKGDINQLVGLSIASVTWEGNEPSSITITTTDGRRWALVTEDDGDGGNDSHAWVSDVHLSPIYGEPITGAREEACTSYGCTLVFETSQAHGSICITHDHNGYYGFSYELNEITS